MMVSVVIEEQPGQVFTAIAPDLPQCQLQDTDPGNAFARIRLAIEGALADLLLAGKPLPAIRSAADWRADSRFAGGRWYEMHMNIGHIEAVARHQQGRARN